MPRVTRGQQLRSCSGWSCAAAINVPCRATPGVLTAVDRYSAPAALPDYLVLFLSAGREASASLSRTQSTYCTSYTSGHRQQPRKPVVCTGTTHRPSYLHLQPNNMGGCLSTAADIYASGGNNQQVEDLQRQVHDLQQQLAAKGGHVGGGAAGAGAAASMYVLWFPIQGMPCRNGGNCRRQGCTYAHQPSSLTRMLDLLYGARSTLDICVFNITCNELAEAVIAAHRRGVRVRVITDNDQALSQGSDIQQLRQEGIPVATDKDQFHMHHKYCVMDRRLVLTGSFNWTRQACLNNQEHVLVVDSPQLAGEYTGHFEHLFAKYGGR